MIASQFRDRRRSARWTAVRPALIIPGHGDSVRCVTMDWSRGGVLLEAEDRESGFEVFNLLIASVDMLVACRVTHRSMTRIGAQFSSSPMRASRFGPVSTRSAKGSVTGLVLRGAAFSSKYRERA